jgi:hypothetical protein
VIDPVTVIVWMEYGGAVLNVIWMRRSSSVHRNGDRKLHVQARAILAVALRRHGLRNSLAKPGSGALSPQ